LNKKKMKFFLEKVNGKKLKKENLTLKTFPNKLIFKR